MSLKRREEFDHTTDEAAMEIGRDIHDALMRDLDVGSPLTVDDSRFEDYADQYPHILFGQLAMYIAGVKPDGKTVVSDLERGRLVVSALHTITSNPKLFETVTGLPFDSADNVFHRTAIEPQAAAPISLQEQRYMKLKSRVDDAGFISREMFDDAEDQLLRVRYGSETLDRNAKRGLGKLLGGAISGWAVDFHLRPAVGHQNIEDYRITGASKLRDTISSWDVPAFEVVAITPVKGAVGSELNGFQKRIVDLGTVSLGSHLDLGYTDEGSWHVVYQDEAPKFDKQAKFNAVCLQAWLGASEQYPLFPTAA